MVKLIGVSLAVLLIAFLILNEALDLNLRGLRKTIMELRESQVDQERILLKILEESVRNNQEHSDKNSEEVGE